MIDLRLGDCLEVLRSIPEGSIDAVVSDPPYGMKWNTKSSRFSGGSRSQKRKRTGRDWPPILGDDRPFDPSPWLRFPKVILWGSNHYAQRLPVGTTLVYVKRNEPQYGSFLSDAEIGWMKGGQGVYLHKDMSMYGVNKNRLHPSQKPLGLMRWCLEKLKLKPGSTILDPYMGSGSTGLAALELGLNFIGIEQDPGYFAAASQRLEAFQAERRSYA